MRTYFTFVVVLFVMAVSFLTGMVTTVEGSRNGESKKILRIDKYSCGLDPCDGYRCVGDVFINQGISVSPACYNSNELKKENCRFGEYKYIPEFSSVCTQDDYYFVWTQ